MKKLSLLILICLNSCVSLKKTTTVSFKEPYVKVFDSLDSPKNQLFLKVNEWMIFTFGSAESVIQYADKEEGVILGKYLIAGTAPASPSSLDKRVYATIDIRVKENKARIAIKPLGRWEYYKFSGYYGKPMYSHTTREEAIQVMDNLAERLLVHLLTDPIDF